MWIVDWLSWDCSKIETHNHWSNASKDKNFFGMDQDEYIIHFCCQSNPYFNGSNLVSVQMAPIKHITLYFFFPERLHFSINMLKT